MITKKLLTFAHRGEARAFFSHFTEKPLSFLDGLYESEDHYLLITGEGPWSAGPKLALALGHLNQKIDLVLNFGIAGSLDQNLKNKMIYKIRTIYLEQNSKMQFKSHTISLEGEDIITCHSRILNKEKSEYLECFAPLVDRELWSLAQSASLLNKEIQSYKIVSDQVGEEVEVCQRVKEDSLIYSDLLLSHYLTLDRATQTSEDSAYDDYFNKSDFYFTVSMTKHRDKILKQLRLKFESIDQAIQSISLEKFSHLETSPKERARLLLSHMVSVLNPTQESLQKSLKKLSSPLTQIGATIKYAKDLERPSISVSASLHNQDDINMFIQGLQKFDHKRLIHIIDGQDLDVH